ncbi:MAG: hypothetical protein ACRETB_10680 [Steroidobacteraceae bacterium]
MSGTVETASALERRARALLEQGVTRVDARTRSRLNRARHAALAAASERGPGMWRSRRLMPVTGAACAAVVAAVLLLHGSGSRHTAPPNTSAQPSLEVLDLLTNDESMSLMENYDHGFYEWAAAQVNAPPGEPGGAKPTT